MTPGDALEALMRAFGEKWAKQNQAAPKADSAARSLPPTDAPSLGVIELAKLFHDTYERLAPSYGYDTRPETKVFDQHTKNGRLMVATVRAIRKHLAIDAALAQQEGAK
jgi:hypothetical protein